MVHANHSDTHHADTRHADTRHVSIHPDPGRITGYAVAIALNAGLLLLLMTPMHVPPMPSLPYMVPQLRWIQSKPVEVTPVQVPPIEEPIKKTKPEPTHTITKPDVVSPQTHAPVLVDNGSELALDMPPTTTEVTATIEPSGSPVPGVRLEYLEAPPPDYPRVSLRMRSEGTVLLQVLVDVDGKPLRADIQDSSGDRRLDTAAREQILRHWRFHPAMQNGHAVQAIGLVPVEFKLRR